MELGKDNHALHVLRTRPIAVVQLRDERRGEWEACQRRRTELGGFDRVLDDLDAVETPWWGGKKTRNKRLVRVKLGELKGRR